MSCYFGAVGPTFFFCCEKERIESDDYFERWKKQFENSIPTLCKFLSTTAKWFPWKLLQSNAWMTADKSSDSIPSTIEDTKQKLMLDLFSH